MVLDDLFVSWNSREFYVSHLPHLFVWSNFYFLHNSQLITFPTQSCLVLYHFWASLLHSLWLTVSALSPHNLYLLFFSLLSITCFKIISLYGIIFAAIKRDSLSILRFSLLSHGHVISCAISLVCYLKYPYSWFSSHFYFLDFVVSLFILKLFLLLLLLHHHNNNNNLWWWFLLQSIEMEPVGKKKIFRVYWKNTLQKWRWGK